MLNLAEGLFLSLAVFFSRELYIVSHFTVFYKKLFILVWDLKIFLHFPQFWHEFVSSLRQYQIINSKELIAICEFS